MATQRCPSGPPRCHTRLQLDCSHPCASLAADHRLIALPTNGHSHAHAWAALSPLRATVAMLSLSPLPPTVLASAQGITALHIATHMNKPAWVEYFLKKGANVEAKGAVHSRSLRAASHYNFHQKPGPRTLPFDCRTLHQSPVVLREQELLSQFCVWSLSLESKLEGLGNQRHIPSAPCHTSFRI